MHIVNINDFSGLFKEREREEEEKENEKKKRKRKLGKEMKLGKRSESLRGVGDME